MCPRSREPVARTDSVAVLRGLLGLTFSATLGVAACSPFPGYDLASLALGVALLVVSFSIPLSERRTSSTYLGPLLFGAFAMVTSQWAELPEAAVRLGGTITVLALALI